MPQQTTAQARVINPILSTQARGYRAADFIGVALFPRANVAQRGGQVLEFGTEAFRSYQTRRAPGSTIKRISFGYLGAAFGIPLNSIEVPIAVELQQDAAHVPGIDLGRRAVNVGMRVMGLSLEIEQATLALTAGNYSASNKVALSGSSRWDTSTGTPISDVITWKEAVRAQVGIDPNVIMLSAKVYNALQTNPQIIDRLKYTGRDSVTTEILAKLFDVAKVVVGKAVSFDETNTPSDVWGKNVVLAYVPQGESGVMEEPSYGYTYTYEGHPAVEEPYYENSSKSWVYGVSDDRQPVKTGFAAGYLAQTVVS